VFSLTRPWPSTLAAPVAPVSIQRFQPIGW